MATLLLPSYPLVYARRWSFLTTLSSLFAIMLTCSPASAAAAQINVIGNGYPAEIRLNAGVIHAPPFAMVEIKDDGSTAYRGYQMDMLNRLKTFAKDDGVDLLIELSPAPSQYGKAFDLIANDCNTTENNPNSREVCEKFDLIIGDYYCNSERSMRAELSPSWLKTSMTTIKYIEKAEGSEDYTTLADAAAAKATVCVPAGTYLSTVVMSKFPNATYIECDAAEGECISNLKSGNCVLFADDELLLHYQASQDPSLQVTRESFNSQYLVWAVRDDMSRNVLRLLKKWMYKAVQTATLDELYFKYFQRERCPHGTAGENCELPCDPDHGTADARGVCVCESARWTGPDCSIEVPLELNLLPTGLVTTCYIMAGINYTLVLICAVWLYRNWTRAQVKMAQPVLLVLILVGCVISTSSIFALAQEDEGDGPVYACAAVPWLYSVGFSMTFGALFTRIRRIYILMQSAVAMKRVKISVKETLVSVAAVLVVDFAILVVWTVYSPLKWKRIVTDEDVFGVPLESEGFCYSDHWSIFSGIIASFHLLLMSVACYMCYLARKIPDRISHSKSSAISMFSNMQIFIISIPILIIVGSDSAASFFVRSSAIWINDFVVVILIFGSLMYKVYRSEVQVRRSQSVVHCRTRKSTEHSNGGQDVSLEMSRTENVSGFAASSGEFFTRDIQDYCKKVRMSSRSSSLDASWVERANLSRGTSNDILSKDIQKYCQKFRTSTLQAPRRSPSRPPPPRRSTESSSSEFPSSEFHLSFSTVASAPVMLDDPELSPFSIDVGKTDPIPLGDLEEGSNGLPCSNSKEPSRDELTPLQVAKWLEAGSNELTSPSQEEDKADRNVVEVEPQLQRIPGPPEAIQEEPDVLEISSRAA